MGSFCFSDKVDGDYPPSIGPTFSDAMNVGFVIAGDVVVEDEGDSGDVDTWKRGPDMVRKRKRKGKEKEKEKEKPLA